MPEAFSVKLERLDVLGSGAYLSSQQLGAAAKTIAVQRPDILYYLADSTFIKPQPQSILIGTEIVKWGKDLHYAPTDAVSLSSELPGLYAGEVMN